MTDKYILRGRDVVPCDDLITWARELMECNQQIAHTFIDVYEVSTIFMGVDMNARDRVLNPNARPLVFETCVFCLCAQNERARIQCVEQCATYDEAEAQHSDIVGRLRKAANG